MSIKSDLKKDGIEIVNKLDTLTINSIAKNISSKITKTFPNFGLNQNDLFIKLSRLDMYRASMPTGMAEANYFYKNSSIYFNSHISDEDLEEFSIHECIHYLQEVKDKRNHLIKMGLCDYTGFKITGLGMNEASVQLMSSKILHIPNEYVKYYGIGFETKSPSYYPLECCLVKQLSYIVGEDILYKSTIFSDDNFFACLSSAISKKRVLLIQSSIDNILDNEETIIKLNNQLLEISGRNTNSLNISKKINELKDDIKLTFMRTQNLIISSYFDNLFDNILTLNDVNNFKDKLLKFKPFLAYVDGYTFFEDYCDKKLKELENKISLIKNGEIFTDCYSKLSLKKVSKFSALLMYLRKLFLKDFKEKNYN